MIPSITDPRWKQIVENPENYKSKVTALPTRVFLGFIKAKSKSTSQNELVKNAYDFFVKNEKVVKNDIDALFS